jgi:hypothetical protein
MPDETNRFKGSAKHSPHGEYVETPESDAARRLF